MSLTLYELSAQEAALDDELDRLLREQAGEITEEAEDLLDLLDLTKGAIREKLDGYYRVLQNYNALKKGLEEEAKRLRDRADQVSKKIEYLESNVQNYMGQNDIREIQTDHTKFRLVGTGGKAPIIIDDEAALPHEFKRYRAEVRWEGAIVNEETHQHFVRMLRGMAQFNVRLTEEPNKTALQEEAESGTTLPVRVGERKKKLRY